MTLHTKLTPIYTILYWKEGFEHRSQNYGSRFLGLERVTPTFPASKAIAIAKNELEPLGYKVNVYQYGFKQRGFRSGEEQCATIYSN